MFGLVLQTLNGARRSLNSAFSIWLSHHRSRPGLEAIAEHGRYPGEPQWIVPAPFSRRGGLAAGRILLDQVLAPRAIFAANEQQAVGLLVAAQERGLSVPGDLATRFYELLERTVSITH